MDIDKFVNDENEQTELGEDEQTVDKTADTEDATETAEAEETTVEKPAVTEAEEAEAEETEPEEAEAGEQKQVPLPALQEERRKRQELQAENERLRQQLDQAPLPEKPAETNTVGMTRPHGPDPYTKVDDDDLDCMSNSEQRKLQLDHEQWQREENLWIAQINQRQSLAAEEAKALDRFSETAMGTGRDYDSVLKTGMNWLTPEDKQVIYRSPDPTKAAYDLCLQRCPYLAVQKPTSVVPSPNKQETDEPEPVTTKLPAGAPTLTKIFDESDELGSLADSFIGD